jgi:hypothetical protein
MKKTKHHFYSDKVKKFMFLRSRMLCPSHLFTFSLVSQKKQWPQSKGAATY